MSQVALVNDALNLLRGKSVRFILEDCDLRMIRNLVDAVGILDLVYDQEQMIYIDPHRETRVEELKHDLLETERLERNRKARKRYREKNPNPKPRGRPRKAA